MGERFQSFFINWIPKKYEKKLFYLLWPLRRMIQFPKSDMEKPHPSTLWSLKSWPVFAWRQGTTWPRHSPQHTTTRGRRTARRRERCRVPRLREGVMLFQSSLQMHAAEPHAAQSHNPRSRARKLELNGHFETTHGISPCGQEPQHFSPRTQTCVLQSWNGDVLISVPFHYSYVPVWEKRHTDKESQAVLLVFHSFTLE